MANNNFTRFDQGIQIYPGFASDPGQGELGEMYFNTTKNVVRTCVQVTPSLEWEDSSIANGTVNGSMLAYDLSLQTWQENIGLVLSGYNLQGNPDSSNNASPAANTTYAGTNKTAGTGNGGNAQVVGGSSFGGLQGNVVLDGYVIYIDAPLSADPVTGLAGQIYYNTGINKFKYFNGSVWTAISSGAGGIYPVKYVDNMSTSLPGLLPYAPDITPQLVNGDTVLFTAMGVSNGVYQATIVLSAISWTKLESGSNTSGAPTIGDFVWAEAGFLRAGRLFVCTNTASATFQDYVAFVQNGSLIEVNFFDPLDTSMPAGPSPTIDGETLVENQTVIFTALTGGEAVYNNQMFLATNVSSGPITWVPVNYFAGGQSPTETDTIIVNNGVGFKDQIGKFNGTTWVFNDKIRAFNGADYWEESGLFNYSAPDNSTSNVFTITALGSENIIVDYSIDRGTTHQTGSLYITQNGTISEEADYSSFIGDTGCTFSTSLSGGNLILSVTTTSTGVAAAIKYSLKRWADAAGGPGGPPSYSVAAAQVTASGPPVPGQIAFWTSPSNLTGNSELTWDGVNNAINLNGMEIMAMQSATLLDNQSSPATLFTLPASYNFAIIEYSIVRNGAYRTGQWILVNNGTIALITDSGVSTADPGVTSWSASISGPNVQIMYTTASTGFNGTVHYNVRRWM